tara:strand:+ start:10 stop:612 length:603 start_codon:yes stop_codon:yes gene_type:complete
MAYGDIIPRDAFNSSSEQREKNGVETINRAVVLKDGSTKGSAAIDFTSNTADLKDLTAVSASNRAALYIGSAGDVCVLLSGQSDPVVTGTADGNTANKLIDSGAAFSAAKTSGTFIQKRDIAVNTTDSTAAFVGAVDSATTLSLVDVSNSNSDTFPDGNETYEIYRAVLFQNVAAGSLLPIQVDRVFALGTTATDITAIY